MADNINTPVLPHPSKQPATIEELRQWYVKHNLPPEEVTRFFIGKDIREPKAFGIYKNDRGECVVYKNKSTGERAVRYQGTDEAYAVGELLLKLKSEIVQRKAKNQSGKGKQSGNGYQSSRLSSDRSSAARSSGRSGSSRSYRPSGQSMFSGSSGIKKTGCIGTIVAAFIGFVMMILGHSIPNGYYQYQGSSYYHQNSSWYRYNPTLNNWSQTTSLDQYINTGNADQYRISGVDGMRFEDTQWYDDGRYEWSDNDSWDDDDNDYSWDDDDDSSWDSDDTDWDSDW